MCFIGLFVGLHFFILFLQRGAQQSRVEEIHLRNFESVFVVIYDTKSFEIIYLFVSLLVISIALSHIYVYLNASTVYF